MEETHVVAIIAMNCIHYKELQGGLHSVVALFIIPSDNSSFRKERGNEWDLFFKASTSESVSNMTKMLNVLDIKLEINSALFQPYRKPDEVT